MLNEPCIRTFTLLLALALAPVASATSSLAPLTPAELTVRADLVVRGTVGEMTSSMENQQIFTRIEVRPSETLKGRASADTVTLRLYGGVHGRLRTRVIGAPCLSPGEEVVLFLKANGPATFDVVSLAEGKLSVVRPRVGPPVVRRDLDGISYLDASGLGRFPTSLDGLKAAVRAAGAR